MPCNSDYMAASGQELESKRVCEFIVYLRSKLNESAPGWVINAAVDYYGNISRLDEATMILCSCCRSLTPSEMEEYIYDAHGGIARDLASWLDRHREWDERRSREEEIGRKKIIARERALRKLTTEEMEALGLT